MCYCVCIGTNGHKTFYTKEVARLARYAHKQCYGSLVDFEVVLKHDAQVSYDEDTDNECCIHTVISSINLLLNVLHKRFYLTHIHHAYLRLGVIHEFGVLIELDRGKGVVRSFQDIKTHIAHLLHGELGQILKITR